MFVDMFVVKGFVIQLCNQYPELVVQVEYSPQYFELVVTIYPQKKDVYSTFIGKAIVYETAKAIGVIFTFFINYLSEFELSVKGCILHGKDSDKR